MRKFYYSWVLLLVAVLVVFASGARAETIIQQFDTDPTISGGWTNTTVTDPCGLTKWYYRPAGGGGYLEGLVYMDLGHKGRYYRNTLLSPSINQASDFWLEMDYVAVKVESDIQNDYPRGFFGLFNSTSADNKHNVLATRYAFEYYVGVARGNRHDVVGFDSTGTGVAVAQMVPGGDSIGIGAANPQIPYDTAVRVKAHYKYNTALHETHADIYVYTIKGDGSLDTLYDSKIGKVINANKSVTVDLFGLCNRQDSGGANPVSNDEMYNQCYVDNLYFSTTGAWSASRVPSFPPFKADISNVRAYTKYSAGSYTIQINADISHRATDSTKTVYVKHNVYLGTNLAFTVPSSGAIGPKYISVGETEDVASSAVTVTSPVLWSPQNPGNVYSVETLILAEDQTTVIKKQSNMAWAGFRNFAVSGKNLQLNSNPIYLRGLSLTPPEELIEAAYSDPGLIDKYINDAKAMGVNIIRLTGSADDEAYEAWYDKCDEKGMMVVAGLYIGWNSTGAGEPNEMGIANEIVARIQKYKHHHSIVAWVYGNNWNTTDSTIRTAAWNIYSNYIKGDPDVDTTRLVFLANSAKLASGTQVADFTDQQNYAGGESGSVYDLYSFGTGLTVPVTISESVGALTNNDDGKAQVADDVLLGNALRNVGHSYNLASDSLEFQAYLAKEAAEIARRGRSTASSLCGMLPYTPPYFFDEYSFEYGIKDANAALSRKPAATALASADELIHVSIELLNPDVAAGGTLSCNMHILNDNINYKPLSGSSLFVQVLNPSGTQVASATYPIGDVAYYSKVTQAVSLTVPSGSTTGYYTLKGTLTKTGDPAVSSINTAKVFVAATGWSNVTKTSPTIGVYDLTGATMTALSGVGVTGATQITLAQLGSYTRVIIGKDSYDAGVDAALDTYLGTAGRKVLVLEQVDSSRITNFNTGSPLSSGLTISSGGEDFVNIERPQLSTLMNGFARTDFRAWNNKGTPTVPNKKLFTSYLNATTGDLDDIAILANAGHHLAKGVLVEVFHASNGNSCTISTMDVVGNTDPKAKKYLANMVDYLRESTTHYKYPEVPYTIKFGSDYSTERGVFAAPLLQGMIVADDNTVDAKPASRELTGQMQLSGTIGDITEVNPSATTATCTMYLRCVGDVKTTTPIIVDAENLTASSKSYTLKVNGTSVGSATLTAGQRLQSSFTPAANITKGTNITLEISNGGKYLKFYSVKLGAGHLADINEDGIVNMLDYAEFAEDYLQPIGGIWQFQP